MDLIRNNTFSVTEQNWQSDILASSVPLWAVVDGVSWPEIQSLLAENIPPHACLYTSTDPNTQRIAPWLVRVEPDSAMQALFESRDPATYSIIFFHSHKGLKQLRDHFRRYTMLLIPTIPDTPVYFRFYDPRVLMDMMTALDTYKLMLFFNGIEAFYIPNSYQLCLPNTIHIFPIPLDHVSLITDACLAIKPAHSDQLPPHASQSFRVSHSELQCFKELMQQRQPLNLATKLYQTYQGNFSAVHYERAAQLAVQQSSNYSIKSENEHMLLADCYLWLGPNFPANSPVAEALLSERDTKRFQRLIAWLQEEKRRIAQG